jgi:hypothetical protein
MVRPDDKPPALDLTRGVAVADVPGISRQIRACNLQHRLFGGKNLNAAAILQLKPPEQIKVRDLGQIDHEPFAVDGHQALAPQKTLIVGEDDNIVALGRGAFQKRANGGKIRHLGTFVRVGMDRAFACGKRRRLSWKRPRKIPIINQSVGHSNGTKRERKQRMHRLSLADDLAEVRSEIARLKRREAHLRQAILTSPTPIPQGRWTRIEVAQTCVRVLDPALLPLEIRQDSRFLRDRITQMVRCLPVQSLASNPRPGWPIQRATAHASLH